MNIQSIASLDRIKKDSYVTPFRTKAGEIFFIVSPGNEPANAYRDASCFEGMTGLDALAQPRKFADFQEWAAQEILAALQTSIWSVDPDAAGLGSDEVLAKLGSPGEDGDDPVLVKLGW
jgi:hypothetical protein